MELHTGHHTVVQWAGMSFNWDTIYLTWLVGAIIIIITVAATRNPSLVPGPLQNAVEYILDGLMSQFKPALGDKMAEVSSLLFTLFLFILVSNEIGLLPNPHIIVSPTNDLNTTLGLAIAGSVSVWVIGVKVKGTEYLKHFFKPFPAFVVINIMEEISKPLTLAFRLFGNILAGEILLEILNLIAPYGVPIIWIVFSLVIGIIQAFIFTILTASYLGSAISDEH